MTGRSGQEPAPRAECSMSKVNQQWTLKVEQGEFESVDPRTKEVRSVGWRATLVKKDGPRTFLGLTAAGLLGGILRELELEAAKDPGG